MRFKDEYVGAGYRDSIPGFRVGFSRFFCRTLLKPDFRPINRINMDAFTPALVFSSLVSMPLDTEQVPLLSASLIAVLLPGILMIPICKLSAYAIKHGRPLICSATVVIWRSHSLPIPLAIQLGARGLIIRCFSLYPRESWARAAQ